MSSFFGRSRSNANLKGTAAATTSTYSSPSKSKGKGTGTGTGANYDSTDSTTSASSDLQPPLTSSSSTSSTSNDSRSAFLAVPSPHGSPERERPSGTLSKRASSALLSLKGRSPSQASLRSIKSTKSQASKAASASASASTSVDDPPRSSASSSGKASSTGTGGAAAAAAAEELPTEMTGKGWRPRPGHPGNLSTEQSAALLDLTGRLHQDGTLPPDDVFAPEDLEVPLCRFLRARSWNVDNAREMWNKSVEWKRSIDLDRLLQEFRFEERPKVAKAGWQMYFHKTDKLGRPIFVQDLAGLDPNSIWTATTPDRIVHNFAVTLERAVRYRYRACSAARAGADGDGRLIEDNLMILDVAGLGMSTFWGFKAQLQQLLTILDNNFPELSGRVQIVNAPWLFSTIWSYLKGWLPPGTVEKIDIQGTYYRDTLLKFIDADDLPRRLGGTCDCAGGCELSDEGPWKGKMGAVGATTKVATTTTATTATTTT